MAEQRERSKFSIFGPGMIITASFVGPGTVTTMTQGGAGFGYSLLWAVLFSIIATIALQEMVARLALVTNEGLGEAIRDIFNHHLLKIITVWFSMVAVAVGCAAYISGDLLGTSLGAAYLLDIPEHIIAPVIGIIILLIGLKGSYDLIEKVMTVLVLIMGVIFITTVIVIQPDFGAVLKGAFVPSIPNGSLLTVIALIGTTVVPYNFFIHATSIHERFNGVKDLKIVRTDTILAIGLGGLISAAILITAGTLIEGREVKSLVELSEPLKPILGDFAPLFMSIGLFSAGLSSAIASPMGAAATISSCLRWKGGLKSKKYRLVFAIVIFIGIITSSLGFEPLEVLLIAQALNGIILPLIAVLIFIILNKKNMMGKFANGIVLNIIGIFVVLVVSFLGIYSLIDAIQSFMS
ncbi:MULTISPECIES: Nramp family divalent metal transporter [Mammaliicoccus]|uniref:Nramp family divalent metal transporter n=1 Tax=Mammaliicoccus fleurettii TaxID=150056 RepID=A0ABS5MN44_9STAP|nr:MULTISPECIES: Nramp family divalent metal transporter [Mammaliicoccus]HCN60825.1 divalent metal cation transporter [Staphylococcus sp.]MBL0847354.1 Nramp family divalent metal transporter [Mammaliicoccus fleurettii]MBO3063392.1 Nramp family divalent metal transporter [Mammaliicoccus fleurettii]MBS3672227.1 Nramp family divalent metal transporter [Mammaliicoccus fleurettii]MBS3697104.1 Nramp family divalent metal transporter [Mammaliicoccus fleurettii]